MLNLFIRLKKEFVELYQRLESQVLASNSFNILKERYQSLSLLNQKLIKVFLMTLFFVIVLYFPLYYISSSSVSWLELKKKYKLSIELLKVREKSSFSNMKSTKKLLKNRINDTVQKYSTEDIQIKESSKQDSQFDFVEQVTFKVDVSYLNIRQAIRLGTELEAISQIRLKELSFKENTQYKNRYDIYYNLSGFVISEKLNSKPKRIKKRRKPRDSAKDKSRDSVKGKLRDSAKDKPRDSVKGKPRDSAQDKLRDSAKDKPRDSVKGKPRDSAQDKLRDSVKDIKNKAKSLQDIKRKRDSIKEKKENQKTPKKEKKQEDREKNRFTKGNKEKEILIEEIEEINDPFLKLDSKIIERQREINK